MFARIPLGLRLVACVVIAAGFASPARCDDPETIAKLQDTVAQLQKKIAVLEDKIKQLEEKQAKLTPDTKTDDEAYVKVVAGTMLDGLIAGDVSAMRGHLTMKLLKGIDTFWDVGSIQHDGKVETWVKAWNTEKYKAHTVDKVIFSPDKDEVFVTGTLTGKDEASKGAFNMTLVKDKDKKKYLLDACSLKAK